MPLLKTPTRTNKTEAGYHVRVIAVLEKYGVEAQKDWDLNPKDFLNWLEAYRDKVSKASWRQIRAALVWFMKNIESECDLSAEILAIDTDTCSEAINTSAKKKKSISDKEKVALEVELLSSHDKFIAGGGDETDSVALNTLLYLLATEITGLRPSEWWGAKIVDTKNLDVDEIEAQKKDLKSIDTITLVVENGKATNGRAFGSHRTIKLKNLSPERKFALEAHYRSVKKHSSLEAFEGYYKSCADRMTYTTRKLWPHRKKYPTLYSGRHQFSANLKREDTALKVIAALMGHGTDRTATEHYGRKNFGQSKGYDIEADQDDINQIHETAKPRYSDKIASQKKNMPNIG